MSLFILLIPLLLSPLLIFAEVTQIKSNLYLGLRNSEVTLLQQKLQILGYFPNYISPTGYFGLITKKAVLDFQKANYIPTTGYVGPLTRAALVGVNSTATGICDYAAPPANCKYVPGPNYNPATSCGMVLSCTTTAYPPPICDYPAPPVGCNYVPGPNYNSTNFCGMVLSCNQ